MSKHDGTSVSSSALAAGIAVLTTVLLLAACQNGTTPPEESKIAFSGKSADLELTEVVSAFETAMAAGKNTIWCGTLQVAWNSLRDEVFAEPILVSEAEDHSNLLNNSRAGAGDISPESYYVKAGFSTAEFLEQLEAEMAEKFPNVTIPEFKADEKVLSYAYLFLAMQFPTPYEIIEHGISFNVPDGEAEQVRAFGIDPDSTDTLEMMKQVEILFHNELEGYQYEYAVDLWKDSSPYQLVLAKVARGESLAATHDRVVELASQYSDDPEYREFNSTDELKVPEIWWKIEHRYSDLEKKPFLNEAFTGQMIAAAYQMIDFKLDNKGVVLESVAYIDGTETAPMLGRRFVFDGPFLLYLKKRDADTPLFAMWVENPELLVKAE